MVVRRLVTDSTLSSLLQYDVQNLVVRVAKDVDNLLVCLSALKLNSDCVFTSLEVENRQPLGDIADEHAIDVDARSPRVDALGSHDADLKVAHCAFGDCEASGEAARQERRADEERGQ